MHVPFTIVQKREFGQVQLFKPSHAELHLPKFPILYNDERHSQLLLSLVTLVLCGMLCSVVQDKIYLKCIMCRWGEVSFPSPKCILVKLIDLLCTHTCICRSKKPAILQTPLLEALSTVCSAVHPMSMAHSFQIRSEVLNIYKITVFGGQEDNTCWIFPFP